MAFQFSNSISLVNKSGKLPPGNFDGANAVWSTRLRIPTYTGPCLQLRRSSNDAIMDFYADASGNLGTALGATGTSYSSWKGAAITYVVTWYDQSGKSNNMSQSVTTAQPIYINGFRMLSFDGINSFLTTTGTTTAYKDTLNTPNFTIISSATSTVNSFGTLISSRQTGNLRGYTFYRDSPNWFFQFGTNGGGWGSLFTTAAATLNIRQILGINQSKTTNTIASTITNTSTAVVTTASTSSGNYTPAGDTIPTRIGAGVTELPTPQYFFNGYINDLFYFGTSLFPAQQTNVSNILYNDRIMNNINAPNFVQVASTSSSASYYSVGISDTGQYILALNGATSGGFLYVSSNFGLSFTTISGQIPTNLCYPCAVSGTGQYMVMMISHGLMYRSSNYGANWAQVTHFSSSQNWTSVALSKNGQYCLASGNTPTNNLYVSANFDTSTPTFTQVSVFTTMSNPPYSNVISNTGDKMIQANAGDGIAISSDYGVSFTKITNSTLGFSTFNHNCITMTPDTNNVYLAKSDGLFKSTNLWSGSPTFTQVTSIVFTESAWKSVVISSDGSYVVASTASKTYYSKDSGSTWAVCYAGRLEMMSMSADAGYIIASNYPGGTSKVILSSI